MVKRFLILLLIFVPLFFSIPVHAQVQSGDIVINIDPPYPRANDQVTASVSSYVTNLDNAIITWVLNGNTALAGVGKKEFSFKVNNTGFPTTLDAQIETSTGAAITKSVTINPADIDMLWEATDAYTPPFYRGKALFPSEGMVKIVAIPDSSNLGGLSYKWELDDNNQPDFSGYGKNFLSFQNSYIEDSNTANVTVTDLSGNGVGVGNITVKPSSPKIVLYEQDPIFGTQWEKSLGNNFIANKNGDTLVAEPYFFSTGDTGISNLTFVWSLNDTEIQTPNPKNILSFKPESGKSGTTTIKVVISNLKTLFQSVDKELNVNF